MRPTGDGNGDAGMKCEFEHRGDYCVCGLCGRKLKKSPAHPCDNHHANCGNARQPQACEHFVEIADQTTEAACGGCQTAKAQTALAECERHGLVTFIARAKDESIRCCLDCKDYQPEKTRVRSDAR